MAFGGTVTQLVGMRSPNHIPNKAVNSVPWTGEENRKTELEIRRLKNFALLLAVVLGEKTALKQWNWNRLQRITTNVRQ